MAAFIAVPRSRSGRPLRDADDFFLLPVWIKHVFLSFLLCLFKMSHAGDGYRPAGSSLSVCPDGRSYRSSSMGFFSFGERGASSLFYLAKEAADFYPSVPPLTMVEA